MTLLQLSLETRIDICSAEIYGSGTALSAAPPGDYEQQQAAETR